MFLPIRLYSSRSSSLTYYQLLDLNPNSSIKEIKLQFKKLSKKYHPDLNQHLSDEAKEENNRRFVEMVNAYDTLKDVKKKREYDASLNLHSKRDMSNKYYSDSKNFRKKGHTTTSSSGLNRTRHHIKYHNGYEDLHSQFSGQHKNYGDRYDVPHFDYDKHLNRNLKFEQRLIDKHLDATTKTKLLNQLKKSSGENVSEEIITQHLLRHINSITTNPDKFQNTNNLKYGQTVNYNHAGSTYASHIYQNPNDSSMFGALALIGGGTLSCYIMYKLIF
ncbi:unnamed protein product [Candida verbasci]|uniref:J domain-containing protein n=1 Tax=Candida verbasci TaxID=1227364 RepID=A0A9W4U2I0_9ASCO|nr:unnamed protein product [Candida verbasci]